MSEEKEEVKQESVMNSVIHDKNEPVVSAKQLLEAGCHFGHRVSRWNPKMREYIFGKRNNLHIIDLDRTAKKIQVAYHALKDIVAQNGKVLFLGTKPIAQRIIKEEAVRSGSFYINKRWLGGTLTNFKTIYKRILLLRDIEMKEQTGVYDNLPKKEVIAIMKQKEKLLANLEGIKEIRAIPQAMVVIDPKVEHNAIREARALHIPIFALGDTNTDPDEIDYLIPANDDGEESIRIITSILADAVRDGKGGGNLVTAYTGINSDENMLEILKTVDSVEQLKSIKAKLRSDALAMKKNSKFSGNPNRGYSRRNDNYNELKNEVEAEESVETKETNNVDEEQQETVAPSSEE